VGYGIALEELCHGYTTFVCNQCVGGYPFIIIHIYPQKNWFRKRMMLISMPFRTVTEKYTKDELFMALEDYKFSLGAFRK